MGTAQLRELYSSDIRRYIWSYIQWPAADDVLQQVFLIIHEKLHTLKNHDFVKSWIYRIAKNTIIDRYRKECSWKNLHFEEEFRNALEDSNTDHQNHQVVTENIVSCIRILSDELDNQSKEVVSNYLEWNKTYAMIAKEMGLSESNIKVIAHRARQKLLSLYKQCCNQYSDPSWRLIDTWCCNNCWCNNSIVL